MTNLITAPLNANMAVLFIGSKIEYVEYVWSQVFLLLSQTRVKRALEIGNGPPFYQAR